MAGNNDFLPFAPTASNVDSQSSYASGGGYRSNGFGAGIAVSGQVNKVLRQVSAIGSMIGSFMAGQNQSANDDGNAPGLLSAFQAALTQYIASITSQGNSFFTTGDTKTTLKTVADSGWIMMNDATIGDASSAASNRANADTQALFTLLWNNFNNTNCPVSGGRGISAAADYAAHKTIALPPTMGRAIAIAGQGSALSARAMGDHPGEETHVLTAAEGPVHNHAITDPGHQHTYNAVEGTNQNYSGGTVLFESNILTGTSTTGISINNSTGGAAHNNMQPTAFINMMVKL